MWLDRYRGILCDLDGCLILGGRPAPGARALVAAAGERLIVVSNNSTDTPDTLAAKLARKGLLIPPDRIVLAGAAAVDHVASIGNGGAAEIYGTRAIVDYAVSLGLAIEPQRPDYVVLARDLRFSYARLQRLIGQIERGAELIVSNIDAYHPGPSGSRIPETGALVAAIQACLPDIRYHSVGKPAPTLYEIAKARLSAETEDLLAIGDNPLTDGEGARRMGIAYALVGADGTAQYRNLADLLHGPGLSSPAPLERAE